MTNADKIRNMTDEELAKFLSDIEYRGYMIGVEPTDKHPSSPRRWVSWLLEIIS